MNRNILVYRGLRFKERADALGFLADKLYEESYVKSEYKDAILKRELEYPTGLPAEIKVAIPHCDHTLVNSPAIAIGILDNEVGFQAMDDPDVTLGVQIIIMLALDQPHGHIEMLQKIVTLIQNPSDLKNIIKSSSNEEVLAIVEKYLS